MAMIEAPYTIPGFETRFAERLRNTVAALPVGAAQLSFDKKPCGGPLLPHFRITPTNPHSAIVEGCFAEGEGINFSIGHGTSGEVYVTTEMGENVKAQEDRFFDICRAVFTTRFSEDLVYNSHGRRVSSRMVLEIDGHTMVLGRHRAFWWLFPNKTRKHFSYEPYY
jgi:hypothetical protein